MASAGLSADFRHRFRRDDEAFASRGDGTFDPRCEHLAGEWSLGVNLAGGKCRGTLANVSLKAPNFHLVATASFNLPIGLQSLRFRAGWFLRAHLGSGPVVVPKRRRRSRT